MSRALLTLSMLAGLFAYRPSIATDEKKPPLEAFNGMVIPLETFLKKQGIAGDPGDRTLVLLAMDGKSLVLVKDDVTRMLFRDERLQNKAIRLFGRRVVGSSIVQAEEVLSMKDGRPHKIFYWCENCQLSYTEAGKCVCCGADTVLREVPVD